MTADDLDAGISIYTTTAGLGTFDAVLAAVAARRGATALASADRTFGEQDAVAPLSPADPDFVRRLSDMS